MLPLYLLLFLIFRLFSFLTLTLTPLTRARRSEHLRPCPKTMPFRERRGDRSRSRREGKEKRLPR